jgi:hypothetical protein
VNPLRNPWDKVDDYAALARHARDLGVGIGAINSNVFEDDDYMLGSVTLGGKFGPGLYLPERISCSSCRARRSVRRHR